MRRTEALHIGADDLAAAAARIALESGLHAVSLDSVAEVLRLSRRRVAKLGITGPELVAAAFARVVAAELADVRRVVLAYSSPVWQMRALLDTLAEPVRVEVDAVWLEAWSLGRRNSHLAAAVCKEEGAWHQYVASLVARGVESADFLPVDPDVVAAQLLAMIDGVNAYSLVEYRSDIDRLEMLYSAARAHLGPRIEVNARAAVPAR